MSLGIMRASLEHDQAEMIAILERNIPGSHQEAHFKWRHRANPAGLGWSWILRDGNGGSMVAMASVFPRKMYVAGKMMLCGQVGEFVVDPNYRSLGPAVLLQRATFEPVESGALALCYDCPPHDQGMSTFLRLGMRSNCEVFRYAFPLRSDEFLAKRLGRSAWITPVVAGANLLLHLRTSRPRSRGLEVMQFEESFGEEFSQLDRHLCHDRAVRASRSAEELNWRYRAHPDWKFRTLIARRAGELQAFLAFAVFDTRASIVDLFGRDLAVAGPALLEAMIGLCRRENISCVEGYCSGASELAPVLRSVGFSERERAARVVAYAKPGRSPAKLLDSGLEWTLCQVEIML